MLKILAIELVGTELLANEVIINATFTCAKINLVSRKCINSL